MDLNRRTLAITIFGVVAIALLGGCTSKWEIDNPYADVDWTTAKRVKANFHTHTTQSDGRFTPSDAIDWYHVHLYEVLALTDHNRVTYPWKDLTDLEPSDGAKKRLVEGKLESDDLTYENRDPKQLNMVALQANEMSRHHHVGSYFNDHAGTTDIDSSLQAIGAKSGIAMLFHPRRYERTLEWYTRLYRTYPHLIGQEVFNQGDRYVDRRGGHRVLWDSIMTDLGGDRPVWGFSNDDMHTSPHRGRNWNILLLPEVSPETVRRGMTEGLTLYVYAPDGHDGVAPPAVESISVDAYAGTITIAATNYATIEWISEGKVVHQGDSVNLNDLPKPGGYLRAMIHGTGGFPVVGTQPFYVRGP
jgi:hypothetical protein